VNNGGGPAELELRLGYARRIGTELLEPLKRSFVGKDEIIDLLGIALVGGENLFLLGPPGTAKSAIVQELGRRVRGRTFDYLLTRFTEPNELFGPFDIRKLREGELVTNTEGMLPEASLIFLDELLNANSAILNSLLLVLNERMFRRGRETRKLPALMVVGASNHLPEDEALGALFDRFLLRVKCDNVPTEQLAQVLEAGWRFDLGETGAPSEISVEDIRAFQGLLRDVSLTSIRAAYVELVHRLRHAGLPISDRRAVKIQRLVAASALLCGRLHAELSDLWVFRYIWDAEEQQEVLNSLVGDALKGAVLGASSHPRAQGGTLPDPESLARDLEHLAGRLQQAGQSETERAYLRDRLGILASRCPWVAEPQQRDFLQSRVNQLWQAFGGNPKS